MKISTKQDSTSPRSLFRRNLKFPRKWPETLKKKNYPIIWVSWDTPVRLKVRENKDFD